MAQDKSTAKKQISNLGVLLVDDYKPSRILLRSFLVRLGLTRLEESNDSIEALRLLLETNVNGTPFDAVFISLGIREMNGIELLRIIRLLSGWSSLPVIIVSENASADIALEAFSAGATEFLLRPYEEETLAQILEKLR